MSETPQGGRGSSDADLAREAVDVHLSRRLSEWEGQLSAATEGTHEYEETLGYRNAEDTRLRAWRETGHLDADLALAVDQRARADLKMDAIDEARREAIHRGLIALGWDPEGGGGEARVTGL
ncbi:hypothetical protein ABZV64_10285 [Streptomyces sp. NPDC004959]|uniref:hypothetical protein n=1 Tax=unclassified Streptomyces TaxID=2593676 RepID=UPI0004CB2517|nr:hypothetical protein [Streptomyces sp. NRRL F-5630]